MGKMEDGMENRIGMNEWKWNGKLKWMEKLMEWKMEGMKGNGREWKME